MPREIDHVLVTYFGFHSFRPLQRDIIEALMAGSDVLALMPTGGGKSICYQVPALAKDGLCLVISPLIALMNDQVHNLRKKNITAFSIHTGMRRKELVSVLEAASQSNCKFLYVSPERLETALFREYLPSLDINIIAVDEAHCISQWGYDFRPPYLRIVQLREELSGIPVIALTASATRTVQQDICDKLSVKKSHPNNALPSSSSVAGSFEIFRQSFERKNLVYKVYKVDVRINKIIDILQKLHGSAIVYCKTRKRTKEISALLNAQGIHADFYNAGLPTEERTKKQQAWIKNKNRIIVCTNAFGMGIDKPDVRAVIHADVPDCLENYYQEAGRAGRDGQKAFAILLYNDDEIKSLKALPDIRYPNLDSIKSVYRSVVNYLQLPEGEVPGESYDFDLKTFTQKFDLDIQTTIYGLKALAQDGWLHFNEQVFNPPTAMFTIYKEDLYEYERMHPILEPLIKTLLRTYEGIFDYPVPISEIYLSQLLKCEANTIIQQLQRLDFDKVLKYNPVKDEPQITLSRRRVKTDSLEINNVQYKERKAVFTERMQRMIAYLNEERACRSKMISNYFGDESAIDCGICDNCLKKEKQELYKRDFDKISLQLKQALQEPCFVEQLLKQITAFRKEHIWRVIDFLTAENKIEMLGDGKLKWK